MIGWVTDPADLAPGDTVQARIRAAMRQRESGDTVGAYDALSRMWPEVESGDAFDRLFFAHTFADVQTSPEDELHWDLIALAAVEHVTEARSAEQGIPGGRDGLRPSLHLNVANCYKRLGDEPNTQYHLQTGSQLLHLLDDGAYGSLIREQYAALNAGDD